MSLFIDTLFEYRDGEKVTIESGRPERGQNSEVGAFTVFHTTKGMGAVTDRRVRLEPKSRRTGCGS